MCVCVCVHLFMEDWTSPGTFAHQQPGLGRILKKWIQVQLLVTSQQHTHFEKHFLSAPDCRHVACVSIGRQECLVISQGSDSQNRPSGTLCHSDRVRTCPIDPAQLSEPMRDARLRSSMDGLGCQRLWMMYNIRLEL